MGAMTKLDAVNQILLAAGENIVSDLENNSGVDTTIAEYLLNQYADDFQFRGLANNRYATKLTIDPVTNKVILPTTIISVDFTTLLYNTDGNVIRVSVKKLANSFFLWNVTDQTDNWSAYSGQELTAVIIVRVDWQDIDTPGQRGVTASAARRYQMLTQGDDDMDRYLQQDEAIYNMKGRSRDMDSKNKTIWSNSDYQTRRAVGRPTAGQPNFRYWKGRTS
jgi:hypothetical protein